MDDDIYEVCLLQHMRDYLPEKLKEAQENGWRIAGQILVIHTEHYNDETWLHIPMKRLITTPKHKPQS